MKVKAAVILVVIGMGLASGAPSAQARTTEEYWSVTSGCVGAVDSRWREDLGAYMSPSGPLDTRLNAAMLQIHSLAALAGRVGVERQDSRARSLVDLLTSAPAFLRAKTPGMTVSGGVPHYPGWSGAASGTVVVMDRSLDPKVAEALADAWRARGELGLSQVQSEAIVERIRSVAKSRLFLFPAEMLNQFNWATDIWTSYARVTGDWSTATVQFRSFLERFAGGIKQPQSGLRSVNLNDGLGFMYGPDHSATAWPNTASSTEYGNIAFSGLDDYDEMVDRGMPRLSDEQESYLRAWGDRNLFGEWTHSGYLNWDTGLGMLRWHSMRYWAWSASGLLTEAVIDRLSQGPSNRAWAAWILDRTLDRYLDWTQQDGLLPEYQFLIPGTFVDNSGTSPFLNAARFGVIAARAARLGLGSREPSRPPSWFAHDPGIRRVAVSTPRYSAALLRTQPDTSLKAVTPVPESGYGGVEVTRLFDSQGRPLSGTGGTIRSAFGVVLTNGEQRLLVSQPLRVFGYGTKAWSVKADGAGRLRGVFSELTADTAMSWPAGNSLSISHRFTSDAIVTTRTIKSKAGGVVAVNFPVWGESPTIDSGWSGKTLSLTMHAANGGEYKAELTGIPSNATVTRESQSGQGSTPLTRLTAVVRFPLGKGKSIKFSQTVSPS